MLGFISCRRAEPRRIARRLIRVLGTYSDLLLGHFKLSYVLFQTDLLLPKLSVPFYYTPSAFAWQEVTVLEYLRQINSVL